MLVMEKLKNIILKMANPNSHLLGFVVKKAGDFPSFWHKDSSFITAMEEFYHRVHTKNKLL
jgi:uncharacterized Zn finger protein